MRKLRLLRFGVPLAALGASLAGCSRGASPAAAPTPVTSDSAAFEQFIERYLGGGRSGGPGAAAASDPTPAFLDGLSAEAPRRAARRAGEQLAALRRIDTTRLASAQRVDWLLVESALKRTVYDTVLRTPERVPGRYLTLGDLYWRVSGDRPPTVNDWIEIRLSLERAPLAMSLGRRQLRAPPPLWTRLALGTARSYATFLRDEFPGRVAAVAPESLRAALLQAGQAAGAALDAYGAFLRDTLAPGPETSWAAGRAYYDWVLRDVNFLPMNSAAMIEQGRRIHAATKLALDSLAREQRPGTPWRTLVSEMQERHPEAGRISDAYRAHSQRVHALLLREGLITIPPRESLTFVPTPPQLRETYAWGGYGGITLRDSVQVGRFFVTDVVPSMTPEQVAEKLRTQNDGWIPVIALHEGYPGHHLQQVYARRNPRRLRRGGVGGGNTYYGEGWALYAEHWMARAGLFDTPDARLGQLQMRLWRTARVIIDPSLHTGAMSYEEAVRFFMDEVGLERSAAEAEVNRFTTWPTQAPSYIIGWQEIERLERDVRAALGDRFEHRRFVERVLEAGPLPPALLRRVVLEAYGLPDTPS
jgi:uncharacterized protein (DUF885 family)